MAHMENGLKSSPFKLCWCSEHVCETYIHLYIYLVDIFQTSIKLSKLKRGNQFLAKNIQKHVVPFQMELGVPPLTLKRERF